MKPIESFVNQIVNADCLEVMREMPDNSVDLLFCDPPYEYINKSPQGGGFMMGSHKNHFEKISNTFGMTYNPVDFLEKSQRLLKKYNAFFWTSKNLLWEYITFANNNKFKWDILLWLKPNPVPCQNGHFLHDKEYCVYIKESGAYFNANLGYDKYKSYFEYPIGSNKVTTHPTEKPLYIKNFIEVCSRKNDLILDPFLGSGTTVIACKELNRRFIGIEIDKTYYEMAKERLRIFDMQPKLL